MHYGQWIAQRCHAARSARRKKRVRETHVAVEALETRLVLYSVTGNAWPNPAAITLSFMPDGTDMGGVGSNLFASFNANPRLAGQWQTQIMKAAQSWAQQTNVNFIVVPDNGAPSGSGDNQQGDPGYGDIRIGGYAFGNSTLARAYQAPPVNNYSIAGDIAFNTRSNFSIGPAGFDLFSVSVHEFGHALGLNHSSATSAAEMYPSYNGVKPALNADDIAGVRNIYSSNNPRKLDVYDAQGLGNSLAVAVNLNSQIGAMSNTALVNQLDITTISDLDYYTFAAPATTSGTFTVSVQSAGLGMLSPKLTVFAADKSTVLATINGVNQNGTTLTATITGATAGQSYYVLVQGADSTPFSTGAYALALNFGTGATPTVPSPIVVIANGNPISGGGGLAEGGGSLDDLLETVPVVSGIIQDTGQSTNDGVTGESTLSIQGQAAPGTTVKVYNDGRFVGQTPVLLVNTWSLSALGTSLADGTYNFTATSTDRAGNVSPLSASFTVIVDTQAPAAPVIRSVTSGSHPIYVGSAAPNSLVTLSRKGHDVGSVMAGSDGMWTYTTNGVHAGGDPIVATATDLAGNVSSPSAAFSDQTVASPSAAPVVPNSPAPTLTLDPASVATSALGLVASNKTPTFAGTAAAGSVVTILDGAIVLGTTTADALGNWTFKSPKLAKGKHQVTATITDAVDLSSDVSETLSFTV